MIILFFIVVFILILLCFMSSHYTYYDFSHFLVSITHFIFQKVLKSNISDGKIVSFYFQWECS